MTLSGQLTSTPGTNWGLVAGYFGYHDSTTVTLANPVRQATTTTPATRWWHHEKGTLAIGATAQQIPYGAGFGNLNLTATGTLSLNGSSQQINGLIGAAGSFVDGVTGTPTLTVGNNNATGTYDTFAGVIKNSAGTLSLTKTGNGTLTLSGTNLYTGGTTVAAGQLTVTATNGIATSSGLSVASGAEFNYISPALGPTMTLAHNSTMALGSGSTIGVGVSSTTASADTIAVAGAAAMAGTLNLSLSGTPANSTTYTLLTGGSGSTFSTSTSSYNLVNATNYTGTLTLTASSVKITTASATPLGTAYWMGNYAGAPGVWAASNGLSGGAGNWVTSTSSNTPLVPGAATNVNISATGATNEANMTLGGNMSVNSITVPDTLGMTLASTGGGVLTIGSTAGSGITVNSGAGTRHAQPLRRGRQCPDLDQQQQQYLDRRQHRQQRDHRRKQPDDHRQRRHDHL